ncbi:protein PIGBOS1 [Thunnus albacares]|uniref:protein PIGBOS1 n=1 Tax=Thunnus maccoyii TaxID=8240 RepID=UPI001C4C2882|nr:protein PIGBOS1 [Thunnus maccoyii]XP_042265497.1 protein PIGBOS1 [Thunnus maccoyii]XP_044204414.1 protein PIGBOS1 [Thunnus albacares]
MFRRRIPFTQIAFATILGVGGGIYIYKPCFEPELKTSGQKNQDVPKKQNETEGNSSSL